MSILTKKPLKNMRKITSYTEKPAFGGRTIEKDFQRDGKIFVNFYQAETCIRVAVSGFSSELIYIMQPKNPRHIQQNEYWVKRYIDPCHNSTELKQILNIK
jgi:hypothetical protein